jgi:hypothetical protein
MKEYVKLESTYERAQIEKIIGKNIEQLKSGGYTQEDLNDAITNVYVDGLDLYLFFDGFHIGVNNPKKEILWTRLDDATEQVGIIRKSNLIEVFLMSGKIPEGFESYIGEGTIKKFYTYDIDKDIIDMLDEKDPVEEKVKKTFYQDHVDKIYISVIFIKNLDGSYTSVSKTVVQFKEGDKEFNSDVVNLTASQYETLVSLIK